MYFLGLKGEEKTLNNTGLYFEVKKQLKKSFIKYK